MLDSRLREQSPTKEGIIVSDANGVMIAWQDGLARRFSWEQLRQLSLNEEQRGQSGKSESAHAQRVA